MLLILALRGAFLKKFLYGLLAGVGNNAGVLVFLSSSKPTGVGAGNVSSFNLWSPNFRHKKPPPADGPMGAGVKKL